MADEESTTTVVVAITANFGIAVAKGIAGALSGSAAMIAEAAHSLADTTNEVLLLVAVKRSDRPADRRHPFGYGRERYFWTLLAAVGIFVGGGVFAVLQGLHELLAGGGEGGHWVLSYAVLGIAFVLESISWLQARRQLRADADRMKRDVRRQLFATTDPAATTVFIEDSAALIGLVLAGTGVALHQLTGQRFWDSLASIAIGVLLTGAAYVLGRENRSLIIGEAADDRLVDAVRGDLTAYPEVSGVDEILTMVMGRGEVLVAARIDIDDDMRGAAVEDLARRMEREIADRHASVRHFFLDITADGADNPAG
ncbi:MAG TPA: cation diffusion facilitator family transporter [Mycobacteriales bacterium]|jgi:cation diffusion facilitator family transporter|nr:cation diffusion facilitator family transporter [Mycobacteriales bacterium]